MKTSSRTITANRERFGFRRILLVAQVALSLVLLVGALLFATSLRKLMAVDTGFDRKGMVVTWLDFSRLNIAAQQRVQFKREVLERIRALPAVTSAGETAIVPLTGAGIENSVWLDEPDSPAKHVSYFNWVSDGYFKASRIPLLAGRDIDAHDTTSAPRVAVVNTAFARELGIISNPIGKRFRREATPSEPESVFEIVGMVGDTKYYGLRDKIRPIAYLSTAQDIRPSPFAQVMVRSSAPIATVTSVLRSSIAEINPSISIDFRSLDETVEEGLSQDRLVAVLSGFFAALAALIAAIGVYGVISYVVATRRTEIGVRMALGAEPRSIVSLIVRDAVNVLVVGVTVGVIVAVAGRRAIASMLFGFDAADVRPLVGAAMLIAAMALLASYVPARRAGRLDPMSALRNE
jgi:predicted permease